MPYITIKYGDAKTAGCEKLVNHNCQANVVLAYIKKTCGFSSLSVPIDLASENGEVLDLNSKNRDSAKRYLDDRKAYIPVKVIGEFTDDATPTYLPLLDLPADTKLKFAVPEKVRIARKKISIGASATQINASAESVRPESSSVGHRLSAQSGMNAILKNPKLLAAKKRGSLSNVKEEK
ncbi:UNVERIFIED_CONTAM: hypothetical protein HDU68_001880 [Siphonaria sp. JEL0065]|nr:hypothetical protein HDU68_001880 [Siphonaria sp. JEL0065]